MHAPEATQPTLAMLEVFLEKLPAELQSINAIRP